MSLRYRYHLVSMRQFVMPLGGRTVRPRPIIGVALVGPRGARTWDALVDPGSDDTVFPESSASAIGIDLTNAPSGTGSPVGMHQVSLRYAEITLRIATGTEQREWLAWVGFTPVSLVYPLLGFAGFLQYFTATFDGEREQLELTINNLYPGT